MDLDKLINGPLPDWERQQRRELEESSKRFHEDNERYREQARRARNISDAAENALLAAENTAAEVAHEIALFESQIQPNEEARLCIVGGPAGILILPQSIEYVAPDKLIFTGLDQSGSLVRAIQHISQLSIVLKAVIMPLGVKPQRTGFHHPTDCAEET